VSRNGGRPRVLLVEDNDAIRSAFSILLEESGYAVVEAASGAAALRACQDAVPDLILLDLGLPDIGGLEVTRGLRAAPATAHTPILALTGRTLETDREACLAAGCTDYLAKPIDTTALLGRVAALLGR
jgi:CheY-like chemotaxis protein